MEVIVLAGGFGTRLHPVTHDRYPKCLASVAGKPFLHHVLKHLLSQGVTRYIFALSHHADQVITDIETHYSHLACTYSVEHTPLGTGGAIKQALQLCTHQYVLVVNADTYVDFNLAALVQLTQGCLLYTSDAADD